MFRELVEPEDRILYNECHNLKSLLVTFSASLGLLSLAFGREQR